MDTPTTTADKAFHTLRARAACLGMQVYRTDASDGHVTYFSELHGVARRYVDLTALERRIEDLQAEAA